MSKIRFTATIDNDLFERLLIARRDSGIPISQLINRALRSQIHLILNYCNTLGGGNKDD